MAFHGENFDHGVRGIYVTSGVKYMIYGQGSRKSLPDLIAKLGASKVLIVTGKSLYEETSLVKEIEVLLENRHASTFYGIGQHAPIADIQKAIEVAKQTEADVILSIGGGSPIDAGKAIVGFLHRELGVWTSSIAIPTTLSAAETTQIAGYTNHGGKKTAIVAPELVPKALIYDGEMAVSTPRKLWASSGIRALDHAIELLYHPSAPEVPSKRLALSSIADLFTYLPASLADPNSSGIRQMLFLASYSALFPFTFTGNVLFTGGNGLSHGIGNALGATYHIPHGITSCLTLAAVVRFKATTRTDEAKQMARAVEAVGKTRTGDVVRDAMLVADAVDELVMKLGLTTSLTECGVPPNEEESIAEIALPGGRNHSDFNAVVEMIHRMY